MDQRRHSLTRLGCSLTLRRQVMPALSVVSDDKNTEEAMSNLFVKLNVVVACLLGGNAFAQEPGKLAPLPNKLPPSVEQRVGTVDFSRGLPTPTGIQQLFEIQDFQRATQLYQLVIPT